MIFITEGNSASGPITKKAATRAHAGGLFAASR